MVKEKITALNNRVKESESRQEDDPEQVQNHLEGLKQERLKELASRRGLTSNGTRAELVELILDDMFKKVKTSDEIMLEKCLMRWSAKDMRDYLGQLKQPFWGTKTIMQRRIMSCMPIDHAVDAVKLYRQRLAEEGDSEEEEEGRMMEKETEEDIVVMETDEEDVNGKRKRGDGVDEEDRNRLEGEGDEDGKIRKGTEMRKNEREVASEEEERAKEQEDQLKPVGGKGTAEVDETKTDDGVVDVSEEASQGQVVREKDNEAPPKK